MADTPLKDALTKQGLLEKSSQNNIDINETIRQELELILSTKSFETLDQVKELKKAIDEIDNDVNIKVNIDSNIKDIVDKIYSINDVVKGLSSEFNTLISNVEEIKQDFNDIPIGLNINSKARTDLNEIKDILLDIIDFLNELKDKKIDNIMPFADDLNKIETKISALDSVLEKLASKMGMSTEELISKFGRLGNAINEVTNKDGNMAALLSVSDDINEGLDNAGINIDKVNKSLKDLDGTFQPVQNSINASTNSLQSFSSELGNSINKLDQFNKLDKNSSINVNTESLKEAQKIIDELKKNNKIIDNEEYISKNVSQINTYINNNKNNIDIKKVINPDEFTNINFGNSKQVKDVMDEYRRLDDIYKKREEERLNALKESEKYLLSIDTSKGGDFKDIIQDTIDSTQTEIQKVLNNIVESARIDSKALVTTVTKSAENSNTYLASKNQFGTTKNNLNSIENAGKNIDREIEKAKLSGNNEFKKNGINLDTLKEENNRRLTLTDTFNKEYADYTKEMQEAMNNNDTEKMQSLAPKLEGIIQILAEINKTQGKGTETEKVLNGKFESESGKAIQSNVKNSVKQSQNFAGAMSVMLETLDDAHIEIGDSKENLVKAFEELAEKTEETSNSLSKNLSDGIDKLNSFFGKIDSLATSIPIFGSFGYSLVKDPYSAYNLAGIKGVTPDEQRRMAEDYMDQFDTNKYNVAKANMAYGYDTSQEMMDYLGEDRAKQLFELSNGKIGFDDLSKNYQTITGDVGIRNDGDAVQLTEYATLLNNVSGLDINSISSMMETFYRDLEMSADKTVTTMDRVITRSKLAKIPVDEYAQTIKSLAEQYRAVGMDGTDAIDVMENLMNAGFNYKEASSFAGTLPSALNRFSDNEGQVILSGLLQGGSDPFEMLWQSQNVSDPDWAKNMARGMDTMLGMQTTMFGGGSLGKFRMSKMMQDDYGFSKKQASDYINAWSKNDQVTMENILKDIQNEAENEVDPTEVQQKLVDQTTLLADKVGEAQKATTDAAINAADNSDAIRELTKIMQTYLPSALNAINTQFGLENSMAEGTLNSGIGGFAQEHPFLMGMVQNVGGIAAGVGGLFTAGKGVAGAGKKIFGSATGDAAKAAGKNAVKHTDDVIDIVKGTGKTVVKEGADDAVGAIGKLGKGLVKDGKGVGKLVGVGITALATGFAGSQLLGGSDDSSGMTQNAYGATPPTLAQGYNNQNTTSSYTNSGVSNATYNNYSNTGTFDVNAYSGGGLTDIEGIGSTDTTTNTTNYTEDILGNSNYKEQFNIGEEGLGGTALNVGTDIVLSKVLKNGLKANAVTNAITDVAEAGWNGYTEYQDKKDAGLVSGDLGISVKETATDMAISGTSAAVGTLIGGAIGSVIPVIGTGIGAAVGGFAGSMIGGKLSNSATDSLFGEEKETNNAVRDYQYRGTESILIDKYVKNGIDESTAKLMADGLTRFSNELKGQNSETLDSFGVYYAQAIASGKTPQEAIDEFKANMTNNVESIQEYLAQNGIKINNLPDQDGTASGQSTSDIITTGATIDENTKNYFTEMFDAKVDQGEDLTVAEMIAGNEYDTAREGAFEGFSSEYRTVLSKYVKDGVLDEQALLNAVTNGTDDKAVEALTELRKLSKNEDTKWFGDDDLTTFNNKYDNADKEAYESNSGEENSELSLKEQNEMVIDTVVTDYIPEWNKNIFNQITDNNGGLNKTGKEFLKDFNETFNKDFTEDEFLQKLQSNEINWLNFDYRKISDLADDTNNNEIEKVLRNLENIAQIEIDEETGEAKLKTVTRIADTQGSYDHISYETIGDGNLLGNEENITDYMKGYYSTKYNKAAAADGIFNWGLSDDAKNQKNNVFENIKNKVSSASQAGYNDYKEYEEKNKLLEENTEAMNAFLETKEGQELLAEYTSKNIDAMDLLTKYVKKLSDEGIEVNNFTGGTSTSTSTSVSNAFRDNGTEAQQKYNEILAELEDNDSDDFDKAIEALGVSKDELFNSKDNEVLSTYKFDLPSGTAGPIQDDKSYVGEFLNSSDFASGNAMTISGLTDENDKYSGGYRLRTGSNTFVPYDEKNMEILKFVTEDGEEKFKIKENYFNDDKLVKALQKTISKQELEDILKNQVTDKTIASIYDTKDAIAGLATDDTDDENPDTTPDGGGGGGDNNLPPGYDTTGYLGTGQLILDNESIYGNSYFNGESTTTTDWEAARQSVADAGGGIGFQYNSMGLSIAMNESVGGSGRYGSNIETLESAYSAQRKNTSVNINIGGSGAITEEIIQLIQKAFNDSGVNYVLNYSTD